MEETFLAEIRDSSKYPPGSDAFTKKRFETIKNLFIVNHFFKFIAYKLSSFHESRVIVVFSFLKLLTTFVLTVIIFGFIYLALNNISPTSFSSEPGANLFSYLYFSFNKLLTMDVQGFYPRTPLARLLTTFESMFAVFLTLILVFIFTTILKEKYEEELKELIRQLELKSDRLANLLAIEFNTSLVDVEVEVNDKEPETIKFLEKLRLKKNNAK